MICSHTNYIFHSCITAIIFNLGSIYYLKFLEEISKLIVIIITGINNYTSVYWK